MATKRKPGRPRKISSPAEFDKLAEAYFQDCQRREVPPFVTGLALAVGLADRGGLIEYEDREEFSYAVKRAKRRCEMAMAEATARGEVPPAFGIFTLKQHGWSDRVEVDQTIRAETGIAKVPLATTEEEWAAEFGEVKADTGEPSVN